MSIASQTASMDEDDTANLDPALAEWHRMACALADDLMGLASEDARAQRVRELARAEPASSVARALLDVSGSCARSDSARATTLARLAVLAAEEMDPALDRVHLDEEAEDLLCQAEILEENSDRPRAGRPAGPIVIRVEGC
jgi:hypothetical protein